MRRTPPRVLALAELANPDWVSIPLEGWSHCRAIAEVADCHLVTHVRNHENIVRTGLPADRFTTLDSRPLERMVEGIGFLLRGKSGLGQTTATALSAIPYYYFEHLVWRKFGHRIRAHQFDVVHRLTPLSPTIPSILAERCARAGVPFVIGPLNGGLAWPSGFSRARIREREWLSYVRRGYKLLPGYRSTLDESAAIIVGSKATLDHIPRTHREKAIYIPENAVNPARFHMQASGPVRLPLRVVFVGRLVPYKGADILIEAAAPLVRQGTIQIEIVGEGVEGPRLRALADNEQLGNGVTFPGWIKHQVLQDRLIQSHIFGFPSIREFGGAVVLEAMAAGLVPIVVDYGGPGELVTPRTGFAVPMGQRDQIVASFREALRRLVADPSVIRPMGARARRRVLRDFTWQAKAAQVREVYRWVMGERLDRPDFGMPLPDHDGATASAVA